MIEPPIDALIFEKLRPTRTVMVPWPLDAANVPRVLAQLLPLFQDGSGREITLLVNSPGGPIAAGLPIVDLVKVAKCSVATYAIGQAVGTAVLLVAAGTKGRRFALPHARFQVVEPAARSTDEEAVRLSKAYRELLATLTGQSAEGVEKARKGLFLGAEEAVAWGIVDRVVDEVP